jgi:hypothetical protein
MIHPDFLPQRRRRPESRSGLRPIIIERREDASSSSFAGLPLVIEAFEAFGLYDAVRRHVKAKKRARGLSEADWVCIFTMLHFAGGRAVSDLAAMKNDAGLVRAWPILGRAGDRAAYDFLYLFSDEQTATVGKAVIRPESPPLAGLGLVRDHLTRMVQRLRPVDTATLDADASIHEANKREALWTYDGVRGYQPLAIYWAEQGLIVRDQFRDGNVNAGFATLPEIQAAFASIPPGVKTRRFRGDSAFYEHDLLRWLDRNGIEFGVTADMSKQLRAELAGLPDTAWKSLMTSDGRGRPVASDKQWTEVAYVPEEREAKAGDRPFRYFGIRVPAQHDLFEKDENGWKYFAIVSNRSGEGDAIIHWQRGRCGTVEGAHDILKNDTGAGVLPSKDFGANAAWYRLAVLAANLKVALSHAMPQEWRTQRLATWQFRLVRLAGRFTEHARRVHLLLSAGCAAIAEILHNARAFLRFRVVPLVT